MPPVLVRPRTKAKERRPLARSCVRSVADGLISEGVKGIPSRAGAGGAGSSHRDTMGLVSCPLAMEAVLGEDALDSADRLGRTCTRQWRRVNLKGDDTSRSYTRGSTRIINLFPLLQEGDVKEPSPRAITSLTTVKVST